MATKPLTFTRDDRFIAFLILVSAAVATCGPPEPIRLVPLPPGIDYPWRTENAEPDPYLRAAMRRALLVVENAQVGADYYTGRWEPLPEPHGPPQAPEPERVATEPPEAAVSALAQPLVVTVPDVEVPDPAEGSGESRLDEEMSAGQPQDTVTNPSVGGLVDVNSATMEELESLSGIGPSLARRIIDGRPYRDVEDLLGVRGIGPRTLGRFRARVTVRCETCTPLRAIRQIQRE